MAFKKATKQQSRLRLALSGPSGAGKTFTALTLAKHLGESIAVIDTERGSASKYADDVAEFDVVELDHYSVQNYLAAINDAAKAGYKVLVIDSLTHAWAGKGGILDEVDKRGGKFDAWRHATPMQQKLVDALLSYPGHVIATMRAKMDYQINQIERNGRKETTVEKVGLAPVQRDDLSYEFDAWFEMNERNAARVSKTRCSAIAGQVFDKPGKELADILREWLSTGVPAVERPQTQQTQEQSRPLAVVPSDRSGSTAESATTSTDEYGITVPATACPTVRSGGQWQGKLWSEIPGPLLEKMMAENGHRMNEQQVEWGTYLLARRQARKAKEAREAEAAAAESAGEAGVWVADDSASAQGE